MSAVSFKEWLSLNGIFQLFAIVMFVPRNPSPRNGLREPDAPGRGTPKSLYAVAGFLKILYVRLPAGSVTLKWLPLRRLVALASPVICQFVGKQKQVPPLTGNPLDQRVMPESCQPPTIASRALPTWLANGRPWPKGSCQIQWPLIWWRRSKSDGPLN